MRGQSTRPNMPALILTTMIVGITSYIGLEVMDEVAKPETRSAFRESAHTIETSPSLWLIPTGIALLIAIVIGAVVPVVRQLRQRKTHPITTVGRVREVHRRRVATTECIVCSESGNEGVSTIFRERTVILGVPTRTHVEGHAEECLDCFIEQYPITAMDDLGIDAEQVLGPMEDDP